MIDAKYRFSDLIGNQMNISLLKRSIDNNTFRQFTIFSGVLGTGKSTCAKISAMALTCENPNNGEPCCSCAACKENMKAFDLGVDSPYISIINAAKILTREDVNDVIHNIFDLQGSIRNKVFIIEEAHALSKVSNAQTVFLSELDSMPANVYVMFSTTRIFDLTEELKSRAEIYTFGRLSDTESCQLLNSTLEQKGYRIPDDFIHLIVKYGRGIPRSLLRALDFTIDENVTLQELRAHLQIIDDAQLLHLFACMHSKDIRLYIDCLEEIQQTVSSQEILLSLKSFLVQVTFLIEGDIQGTFTKDEANEIKSIFTRDVLYKIVNLVNNSASHISDEDLQMLLLRIRMLLQNRSTANIISDSHTVGAIEKAGTDERRVINTKAATTVSAKKITLDTVRKLQGE